MVSVGALHALSHTLAARAGLAHGACNALLLPAVVRFNAAASPRPGEFAARAGFASIDALCAWARAQCAAGGLPDRLALSDGADLAAIAALAEQDVCLRTNPRKASATELADVLRAAIAP